jgi:hypothetical protein
MKTAHELNAPPHATHYRVNNGVATYYHIDGEYRALYSYSGWIDLKKDTVLDRLVRIEK